MWTAVHSPLQLLPPQPGVVRLGCFCTASRILYCTYSTVLRSWKSGGAGCVTRALVGRGTRISRQSPCRETRPDHDEAWSGRPPMHAMAAVCTVCCCCHRCCGRGLQHAAQVQHYWHHLMECSSSMQHSFARVRSASSLQLIQIAKQTNQTKSLLGET